nr:hypothetical protein Hi04_10k_c361_00003 [uncultured bacterium]
MIPGITTTCELNNCACGSEVTSDRSITCHPCGQHDYQIARATVFNRLGWTCQCCGSDYSPQADHIDGSGKQHREEDPFARNLIRWLVHYGVPDGFQTLCQPCNGSKGNGLNCKKHGVYLGPDVQRTDKPVLAPVISTTVNLRSFTGWAILAA